MGLVSALRIFLDKTAQYFVNNNAHKIKFVTMEYARKKKSKNERGNCFSETAS
jgi:hypothetical protein